MFIGKEGIKKGRKVKKKKKGRGELKSKHNPEQKEQQPWAFKYQSHVNMSWR